MSLAEHLKQLARLFDGDRARLLGLLSDVQVLCARGSHQTAAKVFGEFRILQEQHLRSEDRALEALASAGGCPAELARHIAAEHEQLKGLMETAWKKITAGDHGSFDRSLAELSGAVSSHERGEKEVLLPALAGGIHSPSQLERVVRQLVER